MKSCAILILKYSPDRQLGTEPIPLPRLHCRAYDPATFRIHPVELDQEGGEAMCP